MSWQRNPGIFENSLIPRYKLKKNISLIFDRGRDFCILLDFPVHLLLMRDKAWQGVTNNFRTSFDYNCVICHYSPKYNLYITFCCQSVRENIPATCRMEERKLVHAFSRHIILSLHFASRISYLIFSILRRLDSSNKVDSVDCKAVECPSFRVWDRYNTFLKPKENIFYTQ